MCYLCCHNMALLGGANVLFGQAAILRYHLTTGGTRLDAGFTHPQFFRGTSHHLFRHRGREVLAVTGFPDKVFLLDAGSLALVRQFQLFEGEPVDIAGRPHFCRPETHSPYALAASPDGELLFVIGSGALFVLDVASGAQLEEPQTFFRQPEEEGIAGHVTPCSHC